MSRDENARYYGILVLVAVSVTAIVIQLCWMNHIPQTMVKKIKRLLYCFQAIDESEPASGHQTSSSAPPLAVTEVEDFTIQETTDEVEVFLAELRRSTLAHAAPFSSNREREEFISNLLITKRVVVTSGVQDLEAGDTGGLVLVSVGEEGRDSDYTQDTDILNFTSKGSVCNCAICLFDYRPGDLVCFSHNNKCNHHFHQNCISRWLLQDRDDCPCCRNNYLALSDDDNDDGSISNNGTEEEVEPEQVSVPAPSIDDWIPSYLAPFPETYQDINPTIGVNRAQEDGRNISAVESPPIDSTAMQMGRWADASDNMQTGGSAEPDTDTWSCPSVEETDCIECYQDRGQNTRRRRRARYSPTIESLRDERMQSLQHDDLIREGLMQRLQDQSDEQSAFSASSNSVYTEGANENKQVEANFSENQRQNESKICAICNHEYAVNEELCWSQDPTCAHVFHRRCMKHWIQDKHNYCPFCKLQQRQS